MKIVVGNGTFWDNKKIQKKFSQQKNFLSPQKFPTFWNFSIFQGLINKQKNKKNSIKRKNKKIQIFDKKIQYFFCELS